MSIRADVVIVGAGIVGAACAFELSREKFQVAVVDENGIGMGATAGGMGHIVAMHDSEAQFALTSYSQALWGILAQDLPSDVEYQQCGTIWIASGDEEMVEAKQKHDYFSEHNIPSQILDSHALRLAEPKLREQLAGGLLVPGDAVLYAPRAAAYFLRKAEESGARIFLGKSVEAIGNGTVRLNDQSVFSAKAIINATGQFAARLTPRIDIRPRKGHLLITDRYAGAVQHQLVELGYQKSAHASKSDSVAFNVQPRKTGQLLIGSSRQFDIADSAVDLVILSKMLKRVFEYLPDLRRFSAIRVWTGFRAATPDNLPLIGPWAEDPSIFLATGHEGLGITTSVGTARLAADYFLGRASAISVQPYWPSRQMEEIAHA